MKMTYEEITAPAAGGCVYCSKSEADERFTKQGMKGITSLCHVTDKTGVDTVLWVNAEGRKLNFLPLYVEDMVLEVLYETSVTPIAQTAMLFRKIDEDVGRCYLYNKDDETVRQIRIFADEQMVENFCRIRGGVPYSIALCKMFALPSSQYVTTCWSVYYNNPTELNEEGEPQGYESLLPVDLADADVLTEYGMSELTPVMLEAGQIFKVHNVLYRVLKDENDKLFITKKFFQYPQNNKEREKQPESKNNNDEQKSACRIITLRQNYN